MDTFTNGERNEIVDSWLARQFEMPGLVYCVTCGKFATEDSKRHEGHNIAKTLEEATSKEVMARIKGEI